MAYGIDDTIQQKVDAYRGNPGALQRRYVQNRELIDLLALQKLKSEKDAAARDMQMKMQQQPQTIAQQYEAELAGRTKDEMLQGVAGVMQQRQAQQQRNMQRVANAPRMAQGGIVGFAQGDRVSRQRRELDLDSVTQEEIDAYRKRGGQGRRARVAMSDDDIRQILAEQKAGTPSITDRNTLPGTRRADAVVMADAGMTDIDTTPTFPITEEVQETPPKAPPAAPPAGDEAPPPAEQKDPLMDQIGKSFDASGLTDTTVTVPGSNLGPITAPTVDMTQADEYRAGLADVYRDFMETDPETMAQERRDDAMDFLKLSPEDQAIRKRVIDERKAQENEIAGIERLRYGDPTELRRQRLIQNLIGASGTTVGSTLASGAGASIRERDRQRAGIDALRGERFGVQDKRLVQEGADVTERQNIKGKAFEAGQSGYEQGYNQVRAGAAGIANLGDQAQSFAEKQADRLLAVDEANLTRDTANRKMELQANIKTAEIASSNQLARFRASLVRDTKIIEALMAREKNAIDAERNDVMRTGNTIKMQGVLGRVNQIIATVRQQYITAYAPLIQQAQALGDDADPSINELEKAREMAIDQSTKELQGMIEDLERNVAGGLPGQTPAGSTDGFTVTPVS